MKILTIDIGTGTQDIYLYDSRLDIENGFKLVLPAPTMIVYRRIQQATREGRPILLTGVTMGGGPSAWAAEAHARAGLPIFATPDAARSFNDDLNQVEASGIHVIGEDEARHLSPDTLSLHLCDFDFTLIERTLTSFGIILSDLSAVAVAVFDHGAAPVEASDRQFRFDYLDERIRQYNRLSAFAFPSDQFPPAMTRLQAVVQSAAPYQGPLYLMDTAPAAILGATFDPIVAARQRCLIANVGNFHTLAFRLGPSGIEGVFEHHTGLLDLDSLESLLVNLANGTLTHEQVFSHQGHGALLVHPEPLPLDNPDFNIIVTGPRRSLLRSSQLKPYFAVPFGDMMLAGCFGLLAAIAELNQEWRDGIQHSLTDWTGSGLPPWEAA